MNIINEFKRSLIRYVKAGASQSWIQEVPASHERKYLLSLPVLQMQVYVSGAPD